MKERAGGSSGSNTRGRDNMSRSAPEETEYKKGYEKLRRFVSVFLQEMNRNEDNDDLPPGATSRSTPRSRRPRYDEDDEDLPRWSRSRSGDAADRQSDQPDARARDRQEQGPSERERERRSERDAGGGGGGGGRKKKVTLRGVIDALLDAADRV